MVRIVVLADLHGNVPALEAVLEDLSTLDADEVLVGGDLVGRGPDGSHVAALIRERGWRSVRGNHEDYLLGFRRREVPPEWLEADEWSAARWMAAELVDDDVGYLDSLPLELRAERQPALCLVHGSPRSHSEGLGPWSDESTLDRMLGLVEGDLLVCGHTHRPMDRDVDGGRVVNVGAVGLPFNRDRRAQYGVFDWDGSSWHVELRGVEYDVDETRRRFERSGFRRHGGVTAELLLLELRHATPFLVPFLRWADLCGRRPDGASLGAFLEIFDPKESLREFAARIGADRGSGAGESTR